MAIPTTMFSSTPLNCQLCSEDVNNCEFMEDLEGFNRTKTRKDGPGYYGGWVKKYCSMNEVEDFIIYFPYLMIIIPMVMIASDQGFNA